MSLADLAERDGLKPKGVNAREWLAEHSELIPEIRECRAKGYSWTTITALLKKHHDYRGSADSLLRVMSEQ